VKYYITLNHAILIVAAGCSTKYPEMSSVHEKGKNIFCALY